MQSTSNILMIRPASFGFNEQTAESNAFQNRDAAHRQVQDKALEEFDNFAQTLLDNGVNVRVIEDTAHPRKPDAIFPNNWVSFHENGDVFLYPMQAANRRLERRGDIIDQLEDNFKTGRLTDLSKFEAEGKYLEGTGSMVLDRDNKIAYACLSPRTNADVLAEFCKQAGYTAVYFYAVDEFGTPIYHTNVLMGIGSGFAVLCLESIKDGQEKQTVMASLQHTGKKVIEITYHQMARFAGNVLEVKNNGGETLIVLSLTAYTALDKRQKSVLSKYGKLIYANISTIERVGGGGVRCMLAEVFLPIV